VNDHNRPNPEITGKAAGNIVRHMIAEVEKQMAADEQVDTRPTSENIAKDLQKAHEENRVKGSGLGDG